MHRAPGQVQQLEDVIIHQQACIRPSNSKTQQSSAAVSYEDTGLKSAQGLRARESSRQAQGRASSWRLAEGVKFS